MGNEQGRQFLQGTFNWGAAVKPQGPGARAELPVARPVSETLMFGETVMEAVCERSNLQAALRQVRANRGSPGVHGMTVDALPGFLREPWPATSTGGANTMGIVRRPRSCKPWIVGFVVGSAPCSGNSGSGISDARRNSSASASLKPSPGPLPGVPKVRGGCVIQPACNSPFRPRTSMLSDCQDLLLDQTVNSTEPPWYGPVCPVVWEEGSREPSPYPDFFIF
jgi:hypothetical protein